MPKYYVCSGDLRITLDSSDPETAALVAVGTLHAKPVKQLGHITVVSEHGFPGDVTGDDDMILNTLDLLEELGLFEKFKPEDWV